LFAVIASSAVLVACAPGDTTPSSSPSRTGSPAFTVTPTPTPPAFDPSGTADENLPLFREVTRNVWSGKERVRGRAYIDALVKAGFDKKSMQVTEDHSTVGNPAESIQFSVHWKDGQCLIGQVGPETGAPVTVVQPGLADGQCLIGKTRAIDW
jgi:hypothetical protein